ncbi:MAG: L-ribulose-5-phosphate 3-epimerase [Planctomycetota bacterium]|jgi:L-ribulose-5-phosphate 3-epimerase
MNIDRRSVLKLSAIAALGGLAPTSFAAAKGRPKLKKALKYGMIGEGETVLAKFQLIKELGFDGVEMDSPSDLDLDEVLAAKEATGIEIPGVVDSAHWAKPFSHPDAAVRAEGVAALETALRDCKKLGGTSVLVVPGTVNAQTNYADAYQRSQEEIRKLVPLAEELNVQIAFENVWNNFLLSPMEAARYVDEFESKHVGFHFDIGNIVLYGWPAHWIKILGKRIFKLDIKDYSRKKLDNEGRWKGFSVQIGEGDSDWPAVMQALEEIGYEGWGAAEVSGGKRDRLAQIAANMDKVYAS